MDDFTKILLTSSLTAIGAVVVFVASQILGKLVIEPIQDLKKTLGEIRYSLVFHAQAIMTCSGQVISDSLIDFFDVDSRSKALGDRLPNFECSLMLL